MWRPAFPLQFLRAFTLRLRSASPSPGTLAPPIAHALPLPGSIDWKGPMTRTGELECAWRREPGS